MITDHPSLVFQQPDSRFDAGSLDHRQNVAVSALFDSEVDTGRFKLLDNCTLHLPVPPAAR